MSKAPKPTALPPIDLPQLSDASAAEILDFLYELVFRFEAHYMGQIHRLHQQRRDVRVKPTHCICIGTCTR